MAESKMKEAAKLLGIEMGKPIIRKLSYANENYYCQKCHKQIFRSWKKCNHCNSKIDWSEEE